MPYSMEERYRLRLSAIGIEYHPNRNNRLHPMHYVPTRLEDIVLRAQRAARIKDPARMLLTYWEDRCNCFKKFEEDSDVVSRLQVENFDYYVVNSLDHVILFLVGRSGSASEMITRLQGLIIEDLDTALINEIVRVSALYL